MTLTYLIYYTIFTPISYIIFIWIPCAQYSRADLALPLHAPGSVIPRSVHPLQRRSAPPRLCRRSPCARGPSGPGSRKFTGPVPYPFRPATDLDLEPDRPGPSYPRCMLEITTSLGVGNFTAGQADYRARSTRLAPHAVVFNRSAAVFTGVRPCNTNLPTIPEAEHANVGVFELGKGNISVCMRGKPLEGPLCCFGLFAACVDFHDPPFHMFFTGKSTVAHRSQAPVLQESSAITTRSTAISMAIM